MADKQPKLTLVKFNKADLTRGKHVLIVQSPESRRAVTLNTSVFSVGRHPNNDLVINDKLASRHHATIAWMRYTENERQSDYSYWIIDGKGKSKRSRNGILVNGKNKSLHRLTSGDIILIGNDIKISYSYIVQTTDNSQFLNYCNIERPQYSSSGDKNYKETAVIEDTIMMDQPDHSDTRLV